MPLFHQREALMHLTQIARPGRGERHPGGNAHFVETEEDPCVDHKLVDPLDDRDWRCSMPIRSQ
jgi:hypothetical protein